MSTATRSRSRSMRVAAHAALFMVVGCASTSDDPTRRSSRSGEVDLSVEVQNQTQNAVTVYVWTPSYRDRLGMVESIQTRTYRFEWNLAGPVQFLLDFLAQGCVVSDPISVNEGDQLILTVQPFDRRRASRSRCRG